MLWESLQTAKNVPKTTGASITHKDHLCLSFEILDHRLPFTYLNIHKFPSKLKYALRHAYSKVWIHHCMVCWLALLLKRRRGRASLFVSVDNFDTWQKASRQIVFEWKHTAGKRAHSRKNIACNGFDSCKKLFHPTVLFAEALQRWSLHTFMMSVNDGEQLWLYQLIHVLQMAYN